MVRQGPSDDRSWNLRPGDQVVPHCTVRSRLGGGDSYEAYDAVDDRLFTPVVVKLLRPHLTHDRHALGHLRREIELIDRMRHPLIVRWMHHDAAGERPYVALEKLPGSTVERITASHGPLPPARLVDLGMGLATALHYMRTVDVVHLDVMPRNVIMHERIPRLIDFDLARTSAQAASLTGPTGSPRCRAPEQCDPPRTGSAGFATDIWGLGMTLHMAATGGFPYPPGSDNPDAEVAARFPQLVEEPGALGADVPALLATVIRGCLERDAAARPTPSEVYFALQELSVDGRTSVRTSHNVGPAAPTADGDRDRERFEAALRAKSARRRPPRR